MLKASCMMGRQQGEVPEVPEDMQIRSAVVIVCLSVGSYLGKRMRETSGRVIIQVQAYGYKT